jgi:3'(2'), 5'-bisphosphate nucleotidase
MTPLEVAGFLPGVRALALEAGQRVMELLKDPLVKTRKADSSLVTNADHAANDILRNGLLKAFPDHALLSEETGLEGRAGSDYVWLVDPLDGTRAYAKNVAGFSVMVGLLYHGRPVLGVVVDPLENRVYEAARGHGAFYRHGNEARPARVSSRSDWKDMAVIASTGFPDPLRQRLEQAAPVRFLEPINSVGIKVGYLVRQAADLYVNHHTVHYWDTCAPLAILEEAGGVMTHWDGSPVTYALESGAYVHAGPTLATNGFRHRDFLAFLPRP